MAQLMLVDTGVCNTASLLFAFERIGIKCEKTSCAAVISESQILVLPGVGAFSDGMAALRIHGLVEPIRAHAAAGKPLLGICLGMQLLADGSDEFGTHEGLGLIPGWVRRLPSTPRLRVPNIGWCDMQVANSTKLFSSLEGNTSFYFVHSYSMECNNPAHSVGTIDFCDRKVTVATQRGNIFGVQFHPEKSQDAGLKFLANFAAQVNLK
jgi:glutamine amidotransferase